MTENEQISAAEKFSREWKGHGNEEADYQIFWITLLRDVFGIEKPEKILMPQAHVKIGKTLGKIDLLMPRTKVLIEQKSFGKSLDSAFEQAKRYAENLPPSKRPRWIITCNFSEFQIYDLEEPFLSYIVENVQNFGKRNFKIFSYEEIINSKFKPVIIKLENLPQDFKKLTFILDAKAEHLLPELEVSVAAVSSLKKLYEKFEVEYKKNSKPADYFNDLNILMVRLVFCFYASDSRIFKDKHQLLDYLHSVPEKIRNQALINLFSVLDTPKNLREKNLDDKLKNFPYINGGLFEEIIKIPKFTQDINHLAAMSANEEVLSDIKRFNWSVINPTIFGAMFESILNPEFQRNQGMHYTSIANIHKVIDILFLDDLHRIFNIIKRRRKNKIQELFGLQEKISKIKFLDPACGSGNFLTETYLSLRKLENEILREIDRLGGEIPENPIKVSIDQFFGIEIFSYGVAVAKTALWIAEHQTLQETKKIIGRDIDYLPLGKNTNIHCANALQIDWQKIVSSDELNYIIGNPPFVGTKYQSAAQKSDVLNVCKNFKPLDYVACWYFLAAKFIQGTNIMAAFVSTNSITQGEQVAPLWKILDNFVHIDFAHRTFKWLSESENMAAVHCVIIGFSAAKNKKSKIIIDGDKKISAKNINGYLQDAPNIYIEKRKSPLDKNAPIMTKGSQPTDDGNFLMTEAERDYFLKKYPDSKKFIRPCMGAEEFLNGKKRFCFWFVGIELEEIKNFPEIYLRVEAVKNFRLASKKLATKKSAATPQLFQEIRQPKKNYILVPRVSSENRKYIPIDFLPAETISSDANLMIPDANLFHFGILNSSVHNAWTRAVCGRLKSDYRYSASVVYNNFVWCEFTEENVQKISKTAEKILEVRKNFEGWTLAQLYNEKTMPEELRKAHEENDLAVMEAYGFEKNLSEEEIVRELMNLYKELTSER